jgi:ribosomal RNA-processing protein 8
MPLFEVPGWDVPSSVQHSVKSTKSSKKRKRYAYDEDGRLDEAAFNFEKLVKRLEGGSTPSEKKKTYDESIKLKKMAEVALLKTGRYAEGKKETKGNQKSKEEPSKTSEDNQMAPPKKKQKKKKKSEQTRVAAPDEPKLPRLSKKTKSPEGFGLTPLQSKMKATLDGARFRYASPKARSKNHQRYVILDTLMRSYTSQRVPMHRSLSRTILNSLRRCAIPKVHIGTLATNGQHV